MFGSLPLYPWLIMLLWPDVEAMWPLWPVEGLDERSRVAVVTPGCFCRIRSNNHRLGDAAGAGLHSVPVLDRLALLRPADSVLPVWVWQRPPGTCKPEGSEVQYPGWVVKVLGYNLPFSNLSGCSPPQLCPPSSRPVLMAALPPPAPLFAPLTTQARWQGRDTAVTSGFRAELGPGRMRRGPC